MRLAEVALENIRMYIEDRGYKKVWIAERLNMSRQNLDKILKNEKKVTMDDIECICDILNIKVEDVMKENFQFFKLPENDVEESLTERIALCGKFSSEKSMASLTVIEEMMEFIQMMKNMSQ